MKLMCYILKFYVTAELFHYHHQLINQLIHSFVSVRKIGWKFNIFVDEKHLILVAKIA